MQRQRSVYLGELKSEGAFVELTLDVLAICVMCCVGSLSITQAPDIMIQTLSM